MATPHVAGALALAYSTQNFATPADAFAFLVQNAVEGAVSGIRGGTVNRFLQI